MGDERVDERCLTIARGRMHHHAGRLVEHDELVVFVQNIQRDVLAGNCGFCGRRHDECNLIIGLTRQAGSFIVSALLLRIAVQAPDLTSVCKRARLISGAFCASILSRRTPSSSAFI